MPQPIGAFISKHVYKGRLKTQHAIAERSSCRFLDVASGKETSMGHSWIVRPFSLPFRVLHFSHSLPSQNEREVQAVVHVARKYQREGKSFRVVTPYDPQRTRLEEGLKAAGLVWEDKCFNVDSFQGASRLARRISPPRARC